MSNLHEEALKSKAWPFDEARKVLKRLKGKLPEKGYVLFETGYGPSCLLYTSPSPRDRQKSRMPSSA